MEQKTSWHKKKEFHYIFFSYSEWYIYFKWDDILHKTQSVNELYKILNVDFFLYLFGFNEIKALFIYLLKKCIWVGRYDKWVWDFPTRRCSTWTLAKSSHPSFFLPASVKFSFHSFSLAFFERMFLLSTSYAYLMKYDSFILLAIPTKFYFAHLNI